MKADSMNTCPGCKRHCPMGAPKCKYGRAYFEKAAAACAQEKKEKRRRWERGLTQEGVIWQLISVGRSMKKALRHGEVTERQLVESLTENDREMLSHLLERIRQKNFASSGD